MIHVEHLVKEFGDFKAVRGVNFDVPEGEVLGFLGPNGAGKTTTMRILTCFFPPTSGTVSVGGFDVTKQPQSVRRIIGYLPEGVPLYREMTVEHALDFFANAKGFYKKAAKAAVEEALREAQILDVRHRQIGHLSKGYRQRVGLAQAIIGNPKVLILDEPTVGLDPKQIVEIRELIRRMRGKRTVIISTHILPEVQMTCSRVLIINRGRIAASGTPENLTTDFSDGTMRFDVAFTDVPTDKATHALSELKCVSGIAPKGNNRLIVDTRGKTAGMEILGVFHKNKWNVTELKSHAPTLEDVFIKIISGEMAETSVSMTPEETPEETPLSEITTQDVIKTQDDVRTEDTVTTEDDVKEQN